MTRKITISLYCLLSIFSSGCASVAMTSAQVAYNHHQIESNLQDQYITFQGYQQLKKEGARLEGTSISVATLDCEVLLTGQTVTDWQRDRIEDIIKNIPSVQKVHNFIKVTPILSTLKQVSDVWLTTKIKTKLIASANFDATKIKVVTENGTVYLMGTLLTKDAKDAMQIVRSTEGVEHVVSLFSYLMVDSTKVTFA